jgi:hypothetical protein
MYPKAGALSRSRFWNRKIERNLPLHQESKPESLPRSPSKSATDATENMVQKYARRGSFSYRVFRPPLPLLLNREERLLPECSGIKLFIGGAGNAPPKEVINIDLTPFPGVNLVSDI